MGKSNHYRTHNEQFLSGKKSYKLRPELLYELQIVKNKSPGIKHILSQSGWAQQVIGIDLAFKRTLLELFQENLTRQETQ